MTVLQQDTSPGPAMSTVSSITSDRYITPEYLAHLPTSPESKNEKSPLQLLAQTCSQIGVDNGPSKILSNTDKLKAKEESKKLDLPAGGGSSAEGDKVSFKPYRHSEASERAAASSVSPKSGSSAASSPVLVSAVSTPSTAEHKTKDRGGAQAKHTSSPSPIIQSGLELLTAKPKLSTLPPVSSSPYDPTNPAFRPPGPGLDSAAASFMTAVSSASSAAGGGSRCAMALCKDPGCREPTCPMASYNAYIARLTLSSTAGLPPGYMELLESYKMYSAAAAAAGAGMRLPSSAGPAPAPGLQESQLAAYSQLLGGGAAGLRGPYPSPLALGSRYSPYPKPGYPSPQLPPSLAPPPPLPQLPPHLSSLGAMGAANQQMALYSLLGGRL